MAQVTITINNNDVPKVLSAFGYKATLTDGSANPETSPAFMKRTVKEWVLNRVKQYDRQSLLNTASSTVITPIDIT